MLSDVLLFQVYFLVCVWTVYYFTIGSHRYRGKNLEYFSHSIVSINCGKQKVVRILDQATKTAIRMRRHEVRGHWRILRRGRPDEERKWINAHMRGDASLGFVRQLWEVSK